MSAFSRKAQGGCVVFLQRFSSCFRVCLVSISVLFVVLFSGCFSTKIGGSSTSSSPSGSVQALSPPTTTSGTIINTYTPGVSQPVSKNFFGMTIRYIAVPYSSKAPRLTPFPGYALSGMRLWGISDWKILEPSAGAYNWSSMDETIAAGKQNGVEDYIFTFGNVPPWASTKPDDPCIYGNGFAHPGECAPPVLAALDEFATDVVKRYCGVVKYYEPWNEPNTTGWDGTNEELLEVTQHISRIVKDPANCGCANGACSPGGGVNPNYVLLPPISTMEAKNLAWLDTFLSTAGATYPYADIAAFHQYNLVQPEDAIAQVAAFRSVLSKHGLGNLEVWDTEADWASGTPIDGQQEASWLMRFHTAEIAAGVSRFFWYAYDDCIYGSLYVNPSCAGSLGVGNTLTDPGNAYQVMQSWLIGATLNQCLSYDNGLWMCKLTRSGNYTAWMAWNSKSGTVPVTISADAGLTVYRDWQNNVNPLPSELSIGSEPVLMESGEK